MNCAAWYKGSRERERDGLRNHLWDCQSEKPENEHKEKTE